MQYLIFILRCLKNNVRIQTEDKHFLHSFYSVLLKNTRVQSKGKGHTLEAKESILLNSTINIQGDNCTISIGQDSLLENCKIFMSGNNQTLKIQEGCRLRNTSFWLEDGNNTILIGKQVSCEGAHLAATEPGGRIELGNDCMLSYDIDIRNGDSHVIISETERIRINYPEDIKIGNHVWIGAHARILKGSVISENSIIGTGSIISNIQIEANSLVAGVPGKVLKSNVNWERDRTQWVKN